MKRQILSAATVSCILLAASCNKSELTSNKDSSNSATLSTQTSIVITPQICDVIDFSGLTHGAVISSVQTKNQNWTIPVTGFNPEDRPGGENAAMIFNSSAPIADPLSKDLGTPNGVAVPGGPGVGSAGESGTYANNVAWGNILVIKDFEFPYPAEDDNEGSFTTFDLSGVGSKVIAKSISVIDVELSENETAFVDLYASKSDYENNLAPLNKVSLPNTGQNGVATVDLGNTPGVGFIVVEMNGSMGIDNIEFCKAIVYNGCSYTQGYWKTHGPKPKGNNVNSWPNIQTLTLGSLQYSADEWQSILNQAVKGNGLVSLAHQLIAARLNIANGANGSSISATLAQADALIASREVPPIGDGYLSPSSVSALVEKLTMFNEGTLQGGPKHCE